MCPRVFNGLISLATISRVAPNRSYDEPPTSKLMPYDESDLKSGQLGFNRAGAQGHQTSPAPSPHRQNVNGIAGSERDRSRKQNPYSPSPTYDHSPVTQNTSQNILRRSSIPRKEIGAGSATSASKRFPAAPPDLGNQSRQSGIQKPLPTPPGVPDTFQNQGPIKGQHSKNLDATGMLSAEEVVSRAKGNTYDSEVIEKIAPGQSTHGSVYNSQNQIQEFLLLRSFALRCRVSDISR